MPSPQSLESTRILYVNVPLLFHVPPEEGRRRGELRKTGPGPRDPGILSPGAGGWPARIARQEVYP